MTTRSKSLLWAALGIAISAVAMWFAIRSVDLGTTAQILGGAALAPLVGVLAILVLEVGLRSFRWSTLLPRLPAGGRVPTVRVAPVLLVGYLGNLVLPARLGEAIRAYLISRRESLDLPETIGSVVLERIVDTASLAIMAFVAAVAVGAPAWIVQIAAVGAIGAGLFVAVLFTVGLRPVVAIARRIAGVRADVGVVGRGLDLLVRFGRGAGATGRGPVLAVAASISATSWLLDAVIFWLVGQALGIPLTLPAALLISAITTLGTAVPSAPGYVGTFELAASSVAIALGVEPAPALALALAAHALTVLPVAAAGAAVVVLGGIRLRSLGDEALAARRATSAPQ